MQRFMSKFKFFVIVSLMRFASLALNLDLLKVYNSDILIRCTVMLSEWVGWETHFFFNKRRRIMDKKLNILVNEILDGKNIHLIDVVIRGERKNKIAEVYVDAVDVLDFDALAEVSRALNEKVDAVSYTHLTLPTNREV